MRASASTTPMAAAPWAPRDRRSAWLCAALAGLAIFYTIGTLAADAARGKPHPFGDFFALWSYAVVAHSHPAADLYAADTLQAAQVALGMPPQDLNPFPYPPMVLLALWPLGTLPFTPAYLLWTGSTFLLFTLATCWAGRPWSVIAAAIAPTTAACAVSGQSGFLLAALLVGGLRLVPRRPGLAGILLAMLSYKPQFAALVPVALVAAGQGGCLAAACTAGAGLLLATTAAFGPAIWLAWLQALPGYAATFAAQKAADPLMPTVLANLQTLGAPPGAAWAGQAAATGLAACMVWHAWRRLPQAAAVPVTLAATILTTPHAFIYDLPLLTAGVLLFVQHRLRVAGALTAAQAAAAAAALALPAVMALHGLHAPISTLVVGAFAAVTMGAATPPTPLRSPRGSAGAEQWT